MIFQSLRPSLVTYIARDCIYYFNGILTWRNIKYTIFISEKENKNKNDPLIIIFMTDVIRYCFFFGLRPVLNVISESGVDYLIRKLHYSEKLVNRFALSTNE